MDGSSLRVSGVPAQVRFRVDEGPPGSPFSREREKMSRRSRDG